MENDQSCDDINEFEEVVGQCPRCFYPLVDEMGITVCYHCGWNNDPSL